MTVLIYLDKGVSQESADALFLYFNAIKPTYFITGEALQKRDWMAQTEYLIIPGGRSLPFYESLNEAGNANIIAFVEQGGCYVGFCAGAYYACSETLFAQGLPLELKLPGRLNFFNGRAIGPVLCTKEFAYHSESGACITDIVWQDQTHYPVYFNGGCFFEQSDDVENITTLARYAINQKPAVIDCCVEKGRAILFGVHPELSSRDVAQSILSRLLEQTHP